MKKHPKHRSGQADSIKLSSNKFETTAWQTGQLVCGVDEAGRGCLAGPVVVAAAILHPNTSHPLLVDSKTLSKKELLFMFDWLQDKCTFAISTGSVRAIDKHNIYQATALKMRCALINLLATTPQLPTLIAIDAMPLRLQNSPYHEIEIISMIKGESKSISIAAASILAKVTRDKIMSRTEKSFPGYGLEIHKGYCTKMHQESIRKLRPAVIHRTSYLSWLTKENTEHEQQSIFC
jgi:ribonuclease HII